MLVQNSGVALAERLNWASLASYVAAGIAQFEAHLARQAEFAAFLSEQGRA